MYKLFLSLKFLKHRLVNWISVICVCLAVSVLLIVMAVMGGFHTELLKSYQSISSDLVIVADAIPPMPGRDLRDRILSTPHVEGCATRFYAYGVIGGESRIIRGGTSGIKIFGVDPEQEGTATHFLRHLRSEDLAEDERVRDLDHPFDAEPFRGPDERPRPGIIVGKYLLASVGARVGDLLMLGAAAFAEDEQDPDKRVKMREMLFRVVGAYSSGMYEFDAHTVFVPRRYEYRDEYGVETIDVERDFFGEEGGGREIYVRLDDYRNAPAVKTHLYRTLPPGALVQTWQERHRTFLAAVETEKAIQAVILSLMIVLAGGSIMAVLTMTVVEKTRDIGTIKAIGGTVQGILQIFVLNGFIIGLAGSILGVALGILVIENVNFIDEQIVAKIIGHEIFRPEIYIFEDIPTEIDVSSIVWVVVITLAVSVLASLAPAMKASKYRPVEALRYE